MNDPVISIDRGARSFAVFDGHELIHGFEKYDDEDKALDKAKSIVVEKTDKEPEIVYPSITKIKFG